MLGIIQIQSQICTLGRTLQKVIIDNNQMRLSIKQERKDADANN